VTLSHSASHALCGILVVDKPRGYTSHDVIQVLRRASGVKRIGHAGTLDPLATGVLVTLIGAATRLSRFLICDDKEYLATIAFGDETDTCDADGAVVSSAPIPPGLADAERAHAFVSKLVGQHEQMPPQYSAIKVSGRKSYEVARSGGQMELSTRLVSIRAAELRAIRTEPPLQWDLAFDVSKGTYIRAIARDIGRDLCTAAHLTALRRTRSGHISLDQALQLDEATRVLGSEDADQHFIPAATALGFPIFQVDDQGAVRVSNGVPLPLTDRDVLPDDHPTSVVDTRGRLLAVYERSGDSLTPLVVLPGGCP